MITYKQLTLAEIFEDCQNKFDNDKYQFLSLLDEAIDLDEIIPVSFISHFYASTGRPRNRSLVYSWIMSEYCDSFFLAIVSRARYGLIALAP